MEKLTRILFISLFALVPLVLFAVDSSNIQNIVSSHNSNKSDNEKLLLNQLSRAIYESDLDLAKASIQKGADPNGKLDTGDSILYLAAINLDHNYLRLLLESGGNPNTYDRDRKRNLIFEVLGPKRVKHLEVLLHFKPDLNQVDGVNYTPLMHTATLSNYKSMKLLLDNGADINKVSRFGDTVLDLLNENIALECIDRKCSELEEIKNIISDVKKKSKH